jgi:hypothetical protein
VELAVAVTQVCCLEPNRPMPPLVEIGVELHVA